MSHYIWHTGSVKVHIEALICGPLAIHEKTDDLSLYTITHRATGFAMYGLLSAVGVDTKSIRAVQRFAGDLMARHPGLDKMLHRVHDDGSSPEAQKIRDELISTFSSVESPDDN